MNAAATCFSKSRLMSCLQCEKKLWLELHRPEAEKISASTKLRLASGKVVGGAARKIYDPSSSGVVLDVQALGVERALEKTAETLPAGKPIFEAGFAAGHAYAFADVLLPVPGETGLSWRLVEVKSSTSVKNHHIMDLAIQSYCTRKSGLELVSASIACIDSTWSYSERGEYKGLLTETDLTAQAAELESQVEELIARAQRTAELVSEPPVEQGPHCKSPSDCSFTDYCSSKAARIDHPAEWLPRKSMHLKKLIYDEGCADMRLVPDSALDELQLRVKTHTLSGERFFNAQDAAAEVLAHGLEVQFLDFETIGSAAPLWVGTRPYQQIPFQFSLHSTTENGGLDHHAFLDLSGNDPSEACAADLVNACAGEAPVFAYNASFESRVLAELAGRLPQFRTALLGIRSRLVDLLPISRAYYYHPAMKGSWSIKAVLPTIAPDLDYARLDDVRDGAMAQAAYLEAISPSTSESRRKEIRTALLNYCRLDTLSMVRIWQFFSNQQVASKQQ